jgi:hypothetical protein
MTKRQFMEQRRRCGILNNTVVLLVTTLVWGAAAIALAASSPELSGAALSKHAGVSKEKNMITDLDSDAPETQPVSRKILNLPLPIRQLLPNRRCRSGPVEWRGRCASYCEGLARGSGIGEGYSPSNLGQVAFLIKHLNPHRPWNSPRLT